MMVFVMMVSLPYEDWPYSRAEAENVARRYVQSLFSARFAHKLRTCAEACGDLQRFEESRASAGKQRRSSAEICGDLHEVAKHLENPRDPETKNVV